MEDNKALQDSLVNDDLLLNMGFTKVSWKIEEKPLLIKSLCEHIVISNNKAGMDQFISGIKAICPDLYISMAENKSLFKSVFCYLESEEKLTLSKFRTLFEVRFSPKGSNQRPGEEETILFWEECLDDAKIPINKLLEFLTGTDEIPPLGFHKKIEIQFYQQEIGKRRMPYTSTCALEFFLPRSVGSVNELESLLKQALFDTCGFAMV